MPARVRTAPPIEADRDDYIAAMRDSRRLHGDWVDPPITDAGFTELLERHAGDDFEGYLIRSVADDALVGSCNLSGIIRRNFRSAFIGYAAVAGVDGRGYMREGLGLVLDDAFGRLGLHRIEANIQPGNEASIALVRRLGFVREGYSEKYLEVAGEWRDHERWAIRSELWRPQGRRWGRRAAGPRGLRLLRSSAPRNLPPAQIGERQAVAALGARISGRARTASGEGRGSRRSVVAKR